MKYLPLVARYLLGVIFVIFSLNFWLHFFPMPSPAEGSLAAGFIGALYGSGFLAVVKVFELLGGILLLTGRYVNLALGVLGPIVVVIVLFIMSSSSKAVTRWPHFSVLFPSSPSRDVANLSLPSFPRNSPPPHLSY